ncbi:MAG TPA: DUF2934 domain-containing protein [Steroidobacteraceae bacterium]|nr:DUF2934 domain-containing protein [Steroidobacteraceae bacterium]
MPTRRTTESARTAESARDTDKAPQRRRAAPIKPDAVSGASTPTAAVTSGAVSLSESTRRAMVEQAAYLRAERRGFAPGGEVEDWLLAEAEVDALLRAGNGRPPQ